MVGFKWQRCGRTPASRVKNPRRHLPNDLVCCSCHRNSKDPKIPSIKKHGGHAKLKDDGAPRSLLPALRVCRHRLLRQ